MDIKGFKDRAGTVHQYDFNALTNKPKGPADGEDGGYYTPVVTQLDDDTVQFEFTPSRADMPAVAPVTVELPTAPGSDSGQNPDLTGVVKSVNGVTPDENGNVEISIPDSGGGSDYILPVGGDELGGVKNGGNVTINEDGTMTAPEGNAGWSADANNLLIAILKNIPYTAEQNANVTKLAQLLSVSDEEVDDDYEAWTYVWDYTDGKSMTDSGFAGGISGAVGDGVETVSYDASKGQLVGLTGANTVNYVYLSHPDYATAKKSVCEVVININEMPEHAQGKGYFGIAAILTDGTNFAGFIIHSDGVCMDGANISAKVADITANTDHTFRVEMNGDSYNVIMDGTTIIDGQTVFMRNGIIAALKQHLVSQIFVADNASAYIKSYKYMEVEA